MEKIEKVIERCIDLGSPADAELQREVLRRVFDDYFYVGDKLYKISGSGSIRIAKTDMWDMIRRDVPESWTIEKNENGKMVERFVADKRGVELELRELSYSYVEYEIDPFAPARRVERDIESRTLRIVRDRIYVKPQDKISLSESEIEAIAADYREHFPLLREFLDFFVAARFASDRKKSYMFFRAPSDWGKSFLKDILIELGFLFELRTSDIREDRPVGIDPVQIVNSIGIVIDEFKYFPAEMKNIAHNIMVEPKFGFKTHVPVYAKILMSAEPSESFRGGVDEQIIRRILNFDLVEMGEVGRLVDRAKYRESAGRYYCGVKEYLRREIMRRIDEYLALGRFGASDAADRIIERIWEKYRIPGEESLEERIRELFFGFFVEIWMGKSSDAMSAREREIVANLDLMKDKGEIFIRRPQKTIEAILAVTSDEAFYKKARHKRSILTKLIGEQKVIKVNGKPIRGVLVNMQKLETDLYGGVSRISFAPKQEKKESEAVAIDDPNAAEKVF